MYRIGCSLIIFVVIFSSACSSRQVYDALQNNQKFQCQQFPQPEYLDCKERVNESYDDYSRKRNEAIERK